MKKKITFCLMANFLVSVLLLGCNGSTDGTKAPGSGEQATTEPTEEQIFMQDSSDSENDDAGDSVMLAGIPLEEYNVVYTSQTKDAAETLVQHFGEMFGCVMSTGTDAKTEKGQYEIILGSTSRKKMDMKSFYEYDITVEGTTIYINGYDIYAYSQAILTIGKAIEAENGMLSDLSVLQTGYTLPDREEYIADPSLLYMRWDIEWETPDWLLDYDARKNALLSGGDGRMMSISHRADWQYYPENSIESIISCYYLGVDILELDIQPTKDGVLVLMHDSTLTRMTNAAAYIGKDGYPNSNKVADWTYEQIQTLCLKEGQGGSDSKMTPFRVATLEEALTVCKDRMFIVPDKQDYWKYIDTDEVMASSDSAYLYNDMVKTGNYESILISYGVSWAEEGCLIQKQIYEKSGVVPFIYIRCAEWNLAINLEYFTLNAEPDSYLLQLNGSFDVGSADSYRKRINALSRDVSIGAWTIGDGLDIEACWTIAQNTGIDILMTNHPHEFVEFIVRDYEAKKGAE